MSPRVHVAVAVGYAVVIAVSLLTVQAASEIDMSDVDMDAFREGMVTVTYVRDGRTVTETLPSSRVVTDVSEEHSSARVVYRPWWSRMLATATVLIASAYALLVLRRARRGQIPDGSAGG